MESYSSSPKKKRASYMKDPVSSTIQTSQTSFTATDLAKFGEESFDVESYVRNMLQKLPSEEAVQALKITLADSKDVIARELQKNVYRNYG